MVQGKRASLINERFVVRAWLDFTFLYMYFFEAVDIKKLFRFLTLKVGSIEAV